MKISGVYKITNTVTNDFYIGSSKNVKKRWIAHKCPSTWKNYSNNPMYLDMQKYGVDKFDFQILENVEVDQLKKAEQQFIEKLKPTYNNRNANGWDIGRRKETKKKCQKKYQKTEKYQEYHRKASKDYRNQLCCYNNEILKLAALSERFRKAGIERPTLEAKKYLLVK